MAVLCVFLAVVPAHADKKKPGLFDFSTWKTPAASQREAAQDLAPVTLDVQPATAPGGPVRTVRLRVYADRDYRGVVMRWQTKFRAQIDRINRVVQPVFNVRFEIESLRPWDRSHIGTGLDPIINELEALDPGSETEWVIGLVTPFRGVATSIHQIANARLLARHFVLRAMDDEQEARALDREFKLLSVDERERVYGERKAHKEIVIFLHEWAHTMGVLHSEDRTLFMNPLYDPKQTGFTDHEKQILSLVVDRRLAKPSELFPESAELLALLEKTRAEVSAGSEKELAHVLDVLRRRARGGTATASSAGGSGVDVPTLNIPAPDVETFNRAVNAVNAGNPAESWALLAPLVQKHPRQAAVAGLACHLLVGQPRSAEARAACDAAAKLAPDDPRPLLDAASSYAQAKDFAQAAPLALAASERARAGKPDARTWLHIAQVLHRIGALTEAEAAVARTDRKQTDAQKLADGIETTRRRVALPRDGASVGVPPEKEPAYVSSFWAAAEVVASQNTARARAHLTDLAATYPEAPGVDVLWCELELRAQKPLPAGKRCTASVAKFDEAVRAHFLLGVMAIDARRESAAEKHLRQAILLDPAEPGGWRELVRLYRLTRAKARIAELSARYNTLFSKPMPE